MADVLVCVKRVPDASGQVVLTDDGQAVDGRYAGYTISNHEACAIELAVQLAGASEGSVTVLTVGGPEATEQLRSALAMGPTAAVHVEADPVGLGPADVAREIAAVVREGSFDLVLLGNDAADSGDFQVPIRLAYELDRPVVTGILEASVEGGVCRASGAAPDGGTECFELPLPAVVAVMEGGVEPRYPTIKGRMAAKKVAIEVREPVADLVGSSRVRMTLPPPADSHVRVLGDGAAAASAVVDLFEELRVL